MFGDISRGWTRVTSASWLVVAGGLLAAAVTGMALARDVRLGLALIGACLFLPLVALDLPLALALWIPIAWNEFSHVSGKAPVAGLLLLMLAWFGTHRAAGATVSVDPCVRVTRIALALLLVWVTLSISWAGDRHDAFKGSLQWYLAAVVFLVVTTVAATPARARLVALAFVIGALVSIVIGLSGTGLSTTANSIDLATQQRFAGGAGDPNYLAAGLVAAVALAFGLIAGARGPLARLAGLGAIVACVGALVATESRGGLIAAGAALVVAIVAARRHRAQALALAVAAATAVAAVVVVAPKGADRFTAFDAGGTGRTELWRIARRMSSDHLVRGVGINGFPHYSKDYALQSGPLFHVKNIVDRPLVAHNVYFQQLAETGVVGFALLVVVMGACLIASVLAASRFRAAGDVAMETLSRATTVAMVGMLVASSFISNGTDKRLWLVLALGPALLAVVPGRHPPPAQAASTSP